MPINTDVLDFSYHNADGSDVLEEYIKYIANKKLLRYKHIIHIGGKTGGGKTGESLWSHILNLVTAIEKLRPLFKLEANEMRCLLLALTTHDLNKVERYQILPGGKKANYANAASRENIPEELEDLKVSSFFPEWEAYLPDIIYLAHAHQEGSTIETVFNQQHIDQCRLDMGRLEGPLKFLMKVADVSDNSHSGDHTAWHEKHIRDKLLNHVNTALNEDGSPRRYRFVGHRLAEQRGLLTNIMHNEIVAYLLETYGKDACIDLLYHPEGVDYLLDKRILLQWTAATQRAVAERIGQRFAKLQFEQLAQFIKASPSGIGVDDAAMQSGASLEGIFFVIANIVERKQYRLEWREQRNTFTRQDLEKAFTDDSRALDLKQQIAPLLQETDLVPTNENALKRGEFAMAYRNFLKDHRADQLKALKQDAWSRVARLFQLPKEVDTLYALVDPYRRAYFMARDLPEQSIDQMKDTVLEDLAQLETHARQVLAERKAKKPQREEMVTPEVEDTQAMSFNSAYIVDYLERHLEIWDSTLNSPADLRPVQDINFGESLLRYADPKRQNTQCCYCGSALKAEEWMAIQVPPNIGVQSFSNRLEAGSARDPKRNVCDVCRTQFILEKLAWRSHRDKQGSEHVTFYLHFFPYSYYTQPLLQAWWQSIEKLRDGDHTALFLETRDYFRQWKPLQAGVPTRYYRTNIEGVGIPTLSEALSNTPILPLIVPGGNYGMQFLKALEQTALIAQWFDSRVILSRMPVPSLNLANESIDKEPVALLVENAPRSMNWLVPEATLTRKSVDLLCQKLSKMYQLADKLTSRDEAFEATIYDLVVAAAGDPFALHYEVDRLIEQNATRQKGKKPEYQAIQLSSIVAPLLKELAQL